MPEAIKKKKSLLGKCGRKSLGINKSLGRKTQMSVQSNDSDNVMLLFDRDTNNLSVLDISNKDIILGNNQSLNKSINFSPVRLILQKSPRGNSHSRKLKKLPLPKVSKKKAMNFNPSKNAYHARLNLFK